MRNRDKQKNRYMYMKEHDVYHNIKPPPHEVQAMPYAMSLSFCLSIT